MILGIVGAEEAKFTAESEQRARIAIREAIRRHKALEVASGACHLGGIDIWAIQEGVRAGIETREFPATVRGWSGHGGYKYRNIKIANYSDVVICVVLRDYPPGWNGMRFAGCYHCHTADHVKSGGCWTTRYAREVLGKVTETIIV